MNIQDLTVYQKRSILIKDMVQGVNDFLDLEEAALTARAKFMETPLDTPQAFTDACTEWASRASLADSYYNSIFSAMSNSKEGLQWVIDKVLATREDVPLTTALFAEQRHEDIKDKLIATLLDALISRDNEQAAKKQPQP